MPSRVNPLDYFLDLVTPSLPNQRSAELVAYFDANCAEALEQQVAAALASPGMTTVEMLQHMRQKLLFLGDVSDRSGKSYNVPFSTYYRRSSPSRRSSIRTRISVRDPTACRATSSGIPGEKWVWVVPAQVVAKV